MPEGVTPGRPNPGSLQSCLRILVRFLVRLCESRLDYHRLAAIRH
jgi:hypothetical protein